jgi:PKD repeat protein
VIWGFVNTMQTSVRDDQLSAGSTYNYKIAARNAGGWSAFVDPGGGAAPVANFSGNPTSGTAPLTVYFTDLSTNNPTSWAWDFQNNGSTDSTSQNPSFQYTSAGQYTVKLTATNAAGSDEEIKTNYITVTALQPPVANFTGNPTSGPVPLTVDFTDTSTNNPTSWSWTFGVGGTSTAQNPSHQYTSVAQYTVSLTATNAAGSDGETKTNYIDVQAAAMPTFVAAGAVASGTGAITPALPSGIQTNDILLLFLETANQLISISNQNGGTWTAVASSPQGTGTAGGSSATRLTAYWSRYNGTQGAPTTSDSGNHQIGRIIAVRGCITSGNPWNVTAGGVESTSDTSGAIPGATTTVPNCLVVAAIATSLPDSNGTANFSAWANANLTSVTERTDNTRNAGNGGGLGIATGAKATAGVYGNTTVTCGSSAVKGMMSVALRAP